MDDYILTPKRLIDFKQTTFNWLAGHLTDIRIEIGVINGKFAVRKTINPHDKKHIQYYYYYYDDATKAIKAYKRAVSRRRKNR